MSRKFSISAVAGTLVLVAALAVPTLLGSAPAAVNAQETTPLPRTITVVGEGKATGQPDKAVLNVGVETIAASVREAMDENNATMETIMAALTAQGIAENDIQTSNFSIYMERQQPMLGAVQEGTRDNETTVIYHVTNTVLITVRDLETISTVLEEVTNAGANNIWGINFGIEDTTALQSEARAAAVENARARADELAELNGVAVGQVVSISEVITGSAIPLYRQDVASGLGGGGAPISPGQMEITFQVQITYSIE